MNDATRFRGETAQIAGSAGWQVTSQADADQFRRDGTTIEVAYSGKDFIRNIIRDGPGGEHIEIPYRTIAKIDLLRLWLTGRRSDVIHPSVKRAAGVDW